MATKAPVTPEARALNIALGRALWRLEMVEVRSTEERKSGWTDNRRKYMSQARTLLRCLERESVTVTGPAPKPTADEA